MKKIPTLFQRDYSVHKAIARNEVTPGTEWVIAGEGVATVKWDGTCAMVRAGKLYKRYDAKRGKTPPANFEACQEPDPVTGHWPGWIPVDDGPADRWFREAFQNQPGLADGTYELCGPKIQGNPDGFETHRLIVHGGAPIFDAPRTYEGLREWFKGRDIEGLVWRHRDGRMVKIKKSDFGMKRDD